MSEMVGNVRALWRFPVKSMLGEEIGGAALSPDGVAGDRAYAIRDRETGKIASAKHPKVWPDMLDCRATFVEEPRVGAAPPPALIELADGTSMRSDDPDVDAALSRFFGRDVELARAANNGYTIDQYHPDEDDYDPGGPSRRGRRGAARRGVLQRARPALRRPARTLLRPLPAQRADHLDARPAQRAGAGEPLGRAAIPHERDRRDAERWIRRERLGRPQARDRRRASS